MVKNNQEAPQINEEAQKQQQEVMFKLQMYEQQMKHIQEQLQAVEEGLADLINLNIGLDNLESPNGKEIMANVGRGIFVKAKIDSEDLIVDIGGKNLVKKSVKDTKIILDNQIQKVQSVKEELQGTLQKLQEEMTSLVMGLQGA